MNHEYFMKEALREARKALDAGDVPVGAIVVIDNKIVGRAHNQVELLKDPTAHAEMLAITQAASMLSSQQLQDAVMYTSLEPCLMCAGALVLSRMKMLFYATPDQKTGACGSVFDVVNDNRLNHQVKVVHGLLKDEAQQLLQDFFKMLRKRNDDVA
ncbi:MAG: tRNA adenosine(34) deaminase TadA [Candidatus Omnitrophica bacterium]|nr:tRNA adenosine(34) deaminase TadA [Candidatus Omnitrophota bacterium]